MVCDSGVIASRPSRRGGDLLGQGQQDNQSRRQKSAIYQFNRLWITKDSHAQWPLKSDRGDRDRLT
jgi:hypothetical protein